MDKQVIIIGAGGHGKVAADVIMRCGDRVLGFLDDADDLQGEIAGLPVLGKTSRYLEFREAMFVAAIGDNTVRERLVSQMQGVRWYTAIHPNAVISPLETAIGEGTVVMPGAIVNAGAKIGKHCIINTGAIVEHDNLIGDFSHISVGARIAGSVIVGDRTLVGVGAVVRNNVSICGDCTIGAGAVVVKDIREKGTYVGIPAKRSTV